MDNREIAMRHLFKKGYTLSTALIILESIENGYYVPELTPDYSYDQLVAIKDAVLAKVDYKKICNTGYSSAQMRYLTTCMLENEILPEDLFDVNKNINDMKACLFCYKHNYDYSVFARNPGLSQYCEIFYQTKYNPQDALEWITPDMTDKDVSDFICLIEAGNTPQKIQTLLEQNTLSKLAMEAEYNKHIKEFYSPENLRQFEIFSDL